MFLPDDPESNTRNVDNDNEEKVLVTPEDLMTEQSGSCRASLLSITSEVRQSVFLIIIMLRRNSPELQYQVYLTMMTQVSVSSDQETSTRVWPSPVWWISASFFAVTVCGREEQLL